MAHDTDSGHTHGDEETQMARGVVFNDLNANGNSDEPRLEGIKVSNGREIVDVIRRGL